MDSATAQRLVNAHRRWYQRYEIFPGIVTPGAYETESLWRRMRLPEDLAGLTALDIGASNGFYSRELHRRGA